MYEMKLLSLPPTLLLALFTSSLCLLATATASPAAQNTIHNGTDLLLTSGSGYAYASSCYSAHASYSSAETSYNSAHQWVLTTTELLGGTSLSLVTYYENATTLCDGNARLAYSPAISLSTATLTYPGTVTSTKTVLGTYYSFYPSPSPSCSITPDDCDPLWRDYSNSVSALRTSAGAVPIQTPPCRNQSAASVDASISSRVYGCGPCTIYGDGVELVYFPTSASRDLCASTPTASLTSYGPGAVITAYAGKSSQPANEKYGDDTVFADGHAFTSGTAYISISTVYAVDRCSKTFGSPVKDVVLAMSSQSVLSLRYSQDHFQLIMETDRVTGYPVSYADFNHPVPWSAWNGQNRCVPGGSGGWACSVIYENEFRPQLAIPPEITSISPDFEGCQLWYNGLWDPPRALRPASSAAHATLPGEYSTASASAEPSPSTTTPTPLATVLSEVLPLSTASGSQSLGPTASATSSARYNPVNEPWTQSFEANGQTYWATGANDQVRVGGATLTSGGPTRTLADGVQVSYGAPGLVLQRSTTVHFDGPADGDAQNSATVTSLASGESDGGAEFYSESATITINDHTETAVQNSDGGMVVLGDSVTLTPGQPATTLSNGEVFSAGGEGLVVGWTSTLGNSQVSVLGNGDSYVEVTKTAKIRTGGARGKDGTNTASGDSAPATPTGSAGQMSPSWALSLLAVLIAGGLGG